MFITTQTSTAPKTSSGDRLAVLLTGTKCFALPRMRNRYILLADGFVLLVAACGAFVLRFDWYFVEQRPEFLPYVLAAPPLKLSVLYAFDMYRRFWRYASLDDLLALLLANSAASAAAAMFVLLAVYTGHVYEFSRSVIVLDWLLSFCAMVGIRVSVRLLGEGRRRPTRDVTPPKRVLIVGAGDAGAIVAREIQRNAQLGMSVEGFLDDDPVKVGKRIYSIPVVGGLGHLSHWVESLKVNEVIIAMPKASGTVIRDVVERCRAVGVASKIIPGVFELLDRDISVSRLRKVDITDLLRRAPVTHRVDCSAFVRDRTVLVTGAGGSIGRELCRQIAYGRPRRLVLLGHGENSIFEAQLELRDAFPAVQVEAIIADVRDRARLMRVFAGAGPEIVLHAAAHKHVPLMEANPEEAISNNVIGTQNVADAALTTGVSHLVLISSDKAVSPSSVMGASKRLAERIVRVAGERTGRGYVVVRFGNVLGSRGSVVPYFKRQIESGRPLEITHPEMRRFFMTIPEAVHLVLQAAAMGARGELFVLKMGEPLRIVDLARDLIRLSGISAEEAPLRFTGLRPGEKLQESLWEENAQIHPTAHPEVVRVVEHESPAAELLPAQVRMLMEATSQANHDNLYVALSSLIPTFCPPIWTESGRHVVVEPGRVEWP